VAEQFAGQTGPCAACGQSITIPLPVLGPGYYQPKAGSAAGGASLAVIIVAIAVVLLMIPGVLIALLFPAVSSARQAARRAQSSNNLKQLALAIHNYHDINKCLPPAVVTDADGNPLYSGRVLLLPYLEQQHIYDMWDKTQPWDSEANRPLSVIMIPTFRDPADTGPPGQTSYLFVSGAGTMFEAGQNITFAKVLDGTSTTMMLVEVKGSGINWAQPKDWDGAVSPLPASNHSSGNLVGFADGSVRPIPPSTPIGSIRASASRAAGEAVTLP
jgi:hypothetical protein